jgi:DNA invertase Pin-like site-specific DNA recombinase
MPTKFKCVAYCRVSKSSARPIETQSNDKLTKEPSIQEQIDAIKAFVKLHSDENELVHEPFAEVKSGSSSRNRAQFKEAKRYLDGGISGCNTLLVYMKDRIAGNHKDYINTLWGIESV